MKKTRVKVVQYKRRNVNEKMKTLIIDDTNLNLNDLHKFLEAVYDDVIMMNYRYETMRNDGTYYR